jgi:hypothetical protein
MIKKILGKRLTDGMLKIILFISVLLITVSLLGFLSRIIILEQKWFEIAKNKEIVVMDESGNVWQKKLYSDSNQIAVLFAFSFLKNSLSYNYKNYNDVLRYIRNLVSTPSVADTIKSQIEKELKRMKIVNGEYSVVIDNYIVTQKNNVYEGIYLIKHSLSSETIRNNKTYIVRLNVSLEAPTILNSSGFFISKFEKELYDPDKHGEIFRKKK